jgi:hypothetical protein
MTDQYHDESNGKVVTEEEIENWFDSEEEVEENIVHNVDELSDKYSKTQLRVIRSTLDFTLHTLKTALSDKNYIKISPDYQRRGRWDRKKRSLLIESFLLNVPIPPLFLFENDYNQYEVMDGRQRLETISEYLDNGFALTGLEFWPELQGKCFRDLPSTLQRGLLRRSVTAIVLLAETARGGDDFDIRMVLFHRLNTGGIKLNSQEIRNAVYPGSFSKLQKELSRHDLFTTLWGIPPKTANEDNDPPSQLLNNTLYRSMMDCELVLRFFAIRETVLGNIRGSLRNILDKTMKNKKNMSHEEVDHLRNMFLSTLSNLLSALGKDFIILPATGQPSRPMYDALMVAASMHPEENFGQHSEQIKNRLSMALDRPTDYDILVGRGNTVEAIKERVRKAETILLG